VVAELKAAARADGGGKGCQAAVLRRES